MGVSEFPLSSDITSRDSYNNEAGDRMTVPLPHGRRGVFAQKSLTAVRGAAAVPSERASTSCSCVSSSMGEAFKQEHGPRDSSQRWIRGKKHISLSRISQMLAASLPLFFKNAKQLQQGPLFN